MSMSPFISVKCIGNCFYGFLYAVRVVKLNKKKVVGFSYGLRSKCLIINK